jgi:hypothetical protein
MTREADAIVTQVNAQLDSPDKKAEAKAYQFLADEIHHVSVMRGEEAAQDLTGQVITQLEKQGKLPRVSIGWAKQNYDQIDSYKDDGGISAGEVARYTSQSGSAQAMLSSVMADRLLREDPNGMSAFKDVARRSPNSMSDDLIEKCDLRAFGRQERREDRRGYLHYDHAPDAQPPEKEPQAQKGDDSAKARDREVSIDRDAAKMTTDQIRDMGTFRHGEGYWHVAERLLNAGFPPDDRASNTQIMALTKELVAANHSVIDAHGKAKPMVHPGDTIQDFSPYLPAISKHVPRLAQSMQQLYEANKQKLWDGD